MILNLQIPGNAASEYLAEAILGLMYGATEGGGVFAFASASGAKLLFEDPLFTKASPKIRFHLIVGLDAVTNERAISYLGTVSTETFLCQAFLNDRLNSLFHPKFIWFRKEGRISVIIGSGNLTRGGLRGNYEAFTTIIYEGEIAAAFEKTWSDFLASHEEYLLSLDDERVLTAATRNNSNLQILKNSAIEAGVAQAEDDIDGGEDVEVASVVMTDAVLVAEIPKSDVRWAQANFSLDVFTGFFQATLGTQQRIHLRAVDSLGIVFDEEIRVSVSVKSQNYRIELGAAKGLAYPERQRPIAIFIRTAVRSFIYTIVMPGDQSYAELTDFVESAYTGSARNVKRVVTDYDTLRDAWKDDRFDALISPS